MYEQKLSSKDDSQEWYTGVVAEAKERTGVIKRYDGEAVFFNVSDFEFPGPNDIEEAESLQNQRVHFKIEKTSYGLRAVNIAILQSKK
jgi:cold shock CspA family protein